VLTVTTDPPVTAAPDVADEPVVVLAGRRVHAPWLLVVLLAVAFLVNASPWLAAGFGESHDGRNAAVWASASRAVREEGVVRSRFGGRPETGFDYADHPPLIVAETVAAELVGGEHPLATRAPGWIGSLVALALMCVLLREAGLSRLAVASGIVIVFASTMFFVFGTMLDTFDTCLPFAIALLVAWQRMRQGRPWPLPAMAAVSFLAVLAGWQSTTLLGVVGAVTLVEVIRRRRRVHELAAMALGGAAGLAIAAGWALWVDGSLSVIGSQASDRTASATFAHSFSMQWSNLVATLPVALVIGLIGLVAAVRRPSTRAIAVASTAAVFAFAAAFRGGASLHIYWNYGILVPLAIGAAALVEAALERAALVARREAAAIGAVVVACLCLVVALARPSAPELVLEASTHHARLASTVVRHAPAHGPAFAYVTGPGDAPKWLYYDAHRLGVAAPTPTALRSLARRRPRLLVLVAVAGKPAAVQARLRAAEADEQAGLALVPAREAWAALVGWTWPSSAS
jgi:hypothetical protein